jgi:hypothetical protein
VRSSALINLSWERGSTVAVRNSPLDLWLNEIRSQRIREGRGFVGAEDALTTDVYVKLK